MGFELEIYQFRPTDIQSCKKNIVKTLTIVFENLCSLVWNNLLPRLLIVTQHGGSVCLRPALHFEFHFRISAQLGGFFRTRLR